MTIRDFEKFSPRIAASAFIDDAAVVTGDVVIGEDSSVWPMCSIRGDIHSIRIGARTNIQDGSILHVSHDSEFAPGGFPLSIGDDVTVGHHAVVHACSVGNLCLIGMGSVLLDGAVIEDEVMVGAGSLVPPKKVLESGYLWLGSPVKRARALSDREREFLRYSAAHYVELGKRHKPTT
jgi:carbonic anhydrase/acetyltransferase-like protein (isoleucine patch superfamily)